MSILIVLDMYQVHSSEVLMPTYIYLRISPSLPLTFSVEYYDERTDANV